MPDPGKQFEGVTPPKEIAYLRPMSHKGDVLYAKPDINGEAGVHVHDFDHYKSIVKTTKAHRYDFDTDKFSAARVHHWDHIEQGHTRFTIKAGGGLEDAVKA